MFLKLSTTRSFAEVQCFWEQASNQRLARIVRVKHNFEVAKSRGLRRVCTDLHLEKLQFRCCEAVHEENCQFAFLLRSRFSPAVVVIRPSKFGKLYIEKVQMDKRRKHARLLTVKILSFRLSFGDILDLREGRLLRKSR